jgi:surface glycoprotein (TIGR04207 family)
MSGESTRKRVQAVLFAAIMVVSMVAAGVGGFAGSAAADGHIITVDQNGDGDYTSIDSALDNADPDDRIEIENGTYSNSAGITIGTEGVTLTAADGADPTIEVAPSSVSGTAAVDIQATGVTVSNLTIERIAADGRASDAGHAQGIIVSRSGATIKDNDVVGDLSGSDSDTFDRFDGITVIDPDDGPTTDNIDISDNDVSGFDTGVVITTFYGGDVSDVTISNTDTTNNRIGFVAKTHGGSISGISGSNNDFTGNDGESIVFSPDSYQGYEGLNSVPTTAVSFDGPISVENGDSVQTAINVAADGATISVGPGTYNESAAIPDDPGNNEVGLYVGTPNLTIQGVDSSRNPIADRENVQAHIISQEGTSWGTNGVYVDAPGTTFTGLEFSPDPDSDPNKNFEVVEDDFEVRDSIINGDSGSSIYFNTGNVQSFDVSSSNIKGTISFNNGVGNETPAQNRIVENNRINTINFQGTNPAPWLNYPIGDVQIENNDVIGSVIASGDVAVDFQEIVDSNDFPTGYVVVRNEQGEILSTEQVARQSVQGFSGGDRIRVNRRTIFTSISGAITEAKERPQYVDDSGNPITTIGPENEQISDTIEVGPGTYNESVDVDVQGLTLVGPNAGTPGDASRGDEAIIEQGVKINASEVTVDGLQIENDGQDGIRLGPEVVPDDTLIINNVITNVDGGTFQRYNGPAGAGNGIQVQFNNGQPEGETAENLRIINNTISDISTPDVTSRTTAVGINVLPRGNDVELEIVGNTITHIEAGNSSDDTERSRAISVDTQFDGAINNGEVSDPDNFAGRATGLVISDNEITDITSGDRVRAVALFEDGRVGANEDGITQREGPENFLIAENEFDNISAPGEFESAVFIGGYNDLGNDHAVTANDIEDGALYRFAAPQDGFSVEDSDDLNAVLNYWGENATPDASDDVIYDPVLTTSFEDVDPDPTGGIDEYGSVLELESDGEALAVGFSAPPNETVGELFADVEIKGNLFVYENGEGYESVDEDYTPSTGEVIVITSDGVDEGLVVPVDASIEGDAARPTSVDVENGWNLVATGAADNIDQIDDNAALGGTGTINDALQLQAQPEQPGAPTTEFGAFEGTWLLVDGSGEISTGYAEDQSPQEYYDELLLTPETTGESEDGEN